MIREPRKKNIKITPARDHLGFPTFSVMFFFRQKVSFEPRMELQKKSVFEKEKKIRYLEWAPSEKEQR